MPETSGLPLEDMDILFGEIKGLARNRRQETDRIIAMRGTDQQDMSKGNVEFVEKV